MKRFCYLVSFLLMGITLLFHPTNSHAQTNRTAFFGWETNSAFGEFSGGFAGSGVSFDSSVVRTGHFSLRASALSGVAGAHHGMTLGVGNFYRVYVRVAALPTSSARVLLGYVATGPNIRLNPNGTLSYYVGASFKGTSATALTDTNKWYRIEWRDGSGSNVPLMLIDGITQVTGSPMSWGWSRMFGPYDTVADSYTAYFDDFAQSNIDFPGEGHSVLLLPIADNATGAWTNGAANLFTAVSNTPPLGVADSAATTTSQIRLATSILPQSYIATLQSYANEGILPTDTINAVRAFVIHGEGNKTGAKTGDIAIGSNPAQMGATAFNFGDDAGAAGTYSTGWRFHLSTILPSPIVDINLSPTVHLRATSGVSAGRPVDATMLGLYVEYSD